MSLKIAIVDYGVGNLFSLKSSLRALGMEALVTADRHELERADRIILPGVGAFADAMAKLRSTGLVEPLRELVAGGKQFLGICLGMQMLFDRSYEYGVHEGLGFIEGEVKPLAEAVPDGYKIPQMQWNALKIDSQNKLFKYIKQGDYVYFVHSYYATSCEKDTIATCDYGIDVTAAVARGNVFGTQFHPEKSGAVGLNILRAFAEDDR